MAAAPPSTKEQIGAALLQASQYAGSPTPWTAENAPNFGLDPERGFVARGIPTDAPHLPLPVETPPPSMAPGLGTIGGAPAKPPVPREEAKAAPPPKTAPPAKTETSTYPGAIPDDQQPKEDQQPKQKAYEGAIPDEEAKPEAKKETSAYPGAIPDEESKQPQSVTPPPLPQPQQPETPTPSGTGAGAPQGVPGPLVPGRDAHINALIASGKTPGEAQAIADGQEPKTVTGEKPPPKTPSGDLHTPAEHELFEADPATLSPSQREAQANLIAHWADADKQQVQQTETPSTTATTTEEPPKVLEGNKIQGTSTVFARNYDGSIDRQDNGRGFFGGVNTRDPNLKAVAVPVDVLEKTFGHFAQLNAQGGYDMVDTPEARAIVKQIQSAHVEAIGADGKIHKFPIVDIQGSLEGHPGKVLDLTYGAAKEMGFTDNHGVSYQIIGGDGKPYPIPDNIEFAGGGGKGGGDGALGGALAGQPLFSVPVSGGGSHRAEGEPQRAGAWSSDAGGGGGGTPAAQATAGSIDIPAILGAAALGSMFGRGRAQAPAEEEPQLPSGGMKAANVVGVRTVGAPPPAPESLGVKLLQPPAQPALPPPAAPSLTPLTPLGPDPAVVKALMKRGFTRPQAEAFAAKATVSKPGTAAITGGAGFKPSAQPSGAPPAKQAPPAPAPTPPAKQAATAPPAKQAPIPPQPRVATRIGPEGTTVGVPNPPGGPSPDDPRVKKQKDNLTKGEHFVPGDDFHDQLLSGLPGGHGGRQRQILGQAEQAISDKSPLHISYISAPKEAEKFPTRESRRIQYDEHSPEARLMGTTEGQLVGHSMIPVSVGISPARKAGEPHQSYIQGISTNVLANNFQHVNDKLTAIGRKTPYPQLGQKFFNDLEGYYANLNAGHTATGRGHVLGTEEHPSEPDRDHVPYKLSRLEADFIGTVLNNTAAFAKHGDAEALRQLARINGTLITPEGETNRLRHEIEQHEPGWRQRVLEPSIRSFKTGLIHEVHPDEEHMPATIRPGKEFQDLTRAIARTSERGRPDVPVAASLHHTFADNKAINQIERDFSEERINEVEARSRLKALGEDPDQFQFIGGSGGLITPYEENPEAITPEEHTELKTNLRKQWIGGKMPIEDYRRKAAEVPLPEKPSQPPAASPATPETETVPSPKSITPVKPKPPKPQPEPEPEPVEAEETPETPLQAPKPAAPIPKAKPAPKAPISHESVPDVDPSRHDIPAESNYLYHATSQEHVHDIIDAGKLHAHHPWHGTEQETWPDGSTEKRSYWTHDPGIAKSFYPEGEPALVRAKRSAGEFKRESTGDHYLRKPLNAEHLEIYAGQPNKWTPFKGEAPAPKAPQEPPESESPPQKAAGPPGAKTALEREGPVPGRPVGPPAPGDILPPAKPKKGAKTKEQSGLEAQDLEQAAADRDNISPEDAGRLARIQKIAKGWVKKNPVLHGLSMHAYLTGQKKFPGKLNKEGIGEHFDATNPKLDYSKEEHVQQASDAVVHDIMHSLAGTTTGKPSTAYGWYDRTVRKTMAKVGEIAPKILTDVDHAMAFKLALAITSQGQDVFPNAESAWHIYQYWVKHGKMPTDRKIFGGGIKAEQMEENLAKINDLWEEHGTEGLHKILMSRMTSRELKQKYGLDSGEKADYVVNGAMGLGAKIGAFFSNLNGDFDPTTIDLWFSRNMNLMAGNMFDFSDKATRQDRMEKGEVVKSHLSELQDVLQSGMISNIPQERADKMAQELAALQAHPEGKLDRPTAKALAPEIYNWAREQHRIYQRSYGSKAEGEQKGSYHKDFKTRDNLVAKKLDEATTGLSDDPRTTTERDQWRNIMARADRSLKAAKVHLTNADKQALLWFNIKDLFKMAGSPQRAKADYLDAAHRLVRKVKSGELPGLEQAGQKEAA